MTEKQPDMSLILEHYQRPRNYGLMENPDVDEESLNPGCGDRVRIQARLSGGILEDVQFVGNGCTVSMAAASLLTTMTKGVELTDVVRRSEASVVEALETTVSPRRFDCALLAFRALRRGLVTYYHENRLGHEPS